MARNQTMTSQPFRILALESSCDDTAAAIVEGGRKVRASVRRSQTALHAAFGGVIPEAAARAHIGAVNEVLAEALENAGCTLEDIDAFAATLGPGLIGSLLVGANTAKTLSFLTSKPFIGVHHLAGHVASNYLDSTLEPPFLCLLVSGGHTQLIAVEDWARMRLMGQTLDDAVGEAYDKVARAMGLPYPGGPEIDRLAATGDSKVYPLPTARTEGAYDFSFSGLKTATLRTFEKALHCSSSRDDEATTLQQIQTNLSAAFQHTVVETLLVKTVRCANNLGYQQIAIAGGVSANRGLRERFQRWAAEKPENSLYLPQMSYCTDNAAMIAAAAYFNPLTHDWGEEVFSRNQGLDKV
jgi:N6-L-threonylcarbamoyladenine synthase